MKRITLTLLGALLFTGAAIAKDFENGNFAEGKAPWQGDGTVVYLKPDGSVSATKDVLATPVVEIKLNSTQFRDISQKFETEKGTGALNVEIVYKASPDFLLNEKASKFTKENTWGPGHTMYWSALVFPKVDLCARLDKVDGFCYKLAKVEPGADWQTFKIRWDSVGEKKDVKLSILAPPGDGTLWIKSVSVSK